jgi:hypothetical protein
VPGSDPLTRERVVAIAEAVLLKPPGARGGPHNSGRLFYLAQKHQVRVGESAAVDDERLSTHL